MKHVGKALAKVFLGDYSAYRIYSRSAVDALLSDFWTSTTFRIGLVDESAISSSPDLLIREQVGYAGPGSHAYGRFDGDRSVGICFYWFGSRYLKRNFWPLRDGGAKLVQIITLSDMRGHRVASTLIASSWRDMIQKGFSRAFAPHMAFEHAILARIRARRMDSSCSRNRGRSIATKSADQDTFPHETRDGRMRAIFRARSNWAALALGAQSCTGCYGRIDATTRPTCLDATTPS